MNDGSNIRNIENKITEYPICQFNIVLGEHERIFRSTKKNKYFIVSGNEDLKLVQYAVNSEYKKKKKEGYAVAGEIKFLIPDESYREAAIDLMDRLNFNGSVEVVNSSKKEEVIPKVELPSKDESLNVDTVSDEKDDVIESDNVNDVPELISNNDDEKVITKEHSIVADKDSVKVVDRVFHGDFEMPRHIVENGKKPIKESKKDSEEDISSYMWGDSKKSQIMSDKKHKIDLPVIIFIISFLLLVGAIVLLFVLK